MGGPEGRYPLRALSEPPPKTPVTANRVGRRAPTRRLPLWLLLVPVALAAIVVVLILFLRGEGGGGLPILGGGEDDTVPEFDFRVPRRVEVVATSADADAEALRPAAEGTRDEIVPVLDELFTAAFLDPANWREGDYEDVFALFSDGAVEAARGSVETLTLGVGAGDVFERVTPAKGGLMFRVLFDPEGNPDTVVVGVRFRALAERTDGTYLAIVSSGQFFLRDVDGWKVTAFDVQRSDRETEPPPSPTPSPTSSP